MTAPPSPDPASTPEGVKKASARKIRKSVENLNLAAIGSNFATAPLVGGAMGYGVDWLAGTYPWGMIVGLFLGFISAFLDMLRKVR